VEAETELTAGPRRRVDKYFASQHGKEVAREHHSSQCGLWRVHGESTENGRGRYLGIYEGRLFDVIDKVSQNANFYSYGSGGTIEKVEPIKV
jgi:hypothetical protein